MSNLNSYINVNANSVSSINSITTAQNLSATGDVTGGNVTATGNISGTYLLGNGSFLTGVATSYGNSNVATLLAGFGSNTISTTGTINSGNITSGNVLTGGLISVTGNILTNAQIQSTAFTGGNISWSANNQTDFQGAIKIGGTGRLLSPGGAASITLNNNGANIPLAGITTLSVTGNSTMVGTASTGIGAITAGATNTLLSNTVAGMTANVNNYTQVTFQNLNTGTDATADFILTANNGNDTVNYGDFGIINSGYDNSTPTNSLGNIVYAADTYMYAQGNVSNTSQSGGNLAIGTTVAGKTVKIFAGGVDNNSVIANISNTGVSVTGNVTASNFVGNISITGNVTGTSPNVTLVAGSYSYTFNNIGEMNLPTVGGDEGGQLNLGVAATNTSLQNKVSIDIYQNRIRIFEGSANANGVYLDLAKSPSGVGGELMFKASGLVNAGVDVTLGNLKARIPTSGNRSLQLSTVSGSYSVYGSDVYVAGGTSGSTISNASPLSVTTTPGYINSGLNFTQGGYTDTWTLMDTSNTIAWRITLIIGASFNNNMISIERLV